MRAEFRVVLVLLVGLAGPASAQSIDCTNWRDAPTREAGTQTGMNVCSGREWSEADGEMATAWRAARERAKTVDASNAQDALAGSNVWQALLDGQRAWLGYRDGFCTARRDLFAGGSIAPLVFNTCRTRLTRLRTDELAEFAKGKP